MDPDETPSTPGGLGEGLLAALSAIAKCVEAPEAGMQGEARRRLGLNRMGWKGVEERAESAYHPYESYDTWLARDTEWHSRG